MKVKILLASLGICKLNLKSNEQRLLRKIRMSSRRLSAKILHFTTLLTVPRNVTQTRSITSHQHISADIIKRVLTSQI